jgi:redox-sensitive bicupin YhaK (pirin superfamily)
MITFRDRGTRGQTRTGWLDSKHSFSFGDYYDPAQLGFRSLRVINEDRMIPGAGFPRHSHRDMDIVSYVLEGGLQHKDSIGSGTVIRPGEIQRMSAGTGIEHSEFNASQEEPVHFLQIWIIPEKRGLAPSYEQKPVPLEERSGKLRLVAAPSDFKEKAAAGAVTLHQDARIYVANLAAGESVTHSIAPGRGVWVQVARGIVGLNGTELREGDGAAMDDEKSAWIEAETDSEILLFDLA